MPSQPELKRCDATALQVVEHHDYLWVAQRDVPASAFPETRWEGFDFAGAYSMLFEAPLHVALDNFGEDEHTPWVHTRLGWDEAHVGTVQYHAENHVDRSVVSYTGRQRDSTLRHLIGTRRGDLFSNDFVARFDPVRVEYTLSWADPKTKRIRGSTTRVLIFLVPETARTTRFHVFVSVKIDGPILRRLAPLVHKAVLALSYLEVRDDARFISLVADTPDDLVGMRLNKYDKPVIHNRRLLRRIYRGQTEPTTSDEPDGPTS